MSDEALDDESEHAHFLSTFSIAIEQASKLGLSSNKKMLIEYGSKQVSKFHYKICNNLT